jgi:hypothetical protein
MYAVEMGSGALKIGSDIQKLLRGRIHRQHGDRISLLLLFSE